MKRIIPAVFLLFPVGLILLFFVACGPAVVVETMTSTSTPALEILATPLLITSTPVVSATFATPECTAGLCPEDSLTATAAMAATFAAMPSKTPPPWAMIFPAVGDLGWGSVYGTIFDGATSLPMEGATVTCEHFSYTSPYLCNGVTTTNSDGIYIFTPVFFHDTDHITLLVEAPGYTPLRFEVQEALIPPADFKVDLGLFPVTDGSLTPTPFPIMCTAPACSDGVLVCGVPDGCSLGCGSICMPYTPTP